MSKPALKLSRLPDRKPAKLTISLEPDLLEDLKTYAALYGDVYGEKQSISGLAPFMLRAFIDSDAGFRRARKQRLTGDASAPGGRQSNRAGANSVE